MPSVDQKNKPCGLMDRDLCLQLETFGSCKACTYRQTKEMRQAINRQREGWLDAGYNTFVKIEEE